MSCAEDTQKLARFFKNLGEEKEYPAREKMCIEMNNKNNTPVIAITYYLLNLVITLKEK